MRKVISFLILILIIASCDKQGGGTQPEPYKRPIPTKLYYNGTLKKSIVLDSNSRVIQFTSYSTSSQNQQYFVKYDPQGKIDSVYRLFNSKKLGTYFIYPSVDSIYVRRFNDTTWDYDYGIRFSSSNIEHIYFNGSKDFQWDLSGDTILETKLTTQDNFVLGDSINPLWIEDNPFFSWYHFYYPDIIFSARMPISRNKINSSSSEIYDNFYDSQGRLIERRAIHSNGNINTMEFSYN